MSRHKGMIRFSGRVGNKWRFRVWVAVKVWVEIDIGVEVGVGIGLE